MIREMRVREEAIIDRAARRVEGARRKGGNGVHGGAVTGGEAGDARRTEYRVEGRVAK